MGGSGDDDALCGPSTGTDVGGGLTSFFMDIYIQS